MGMYFYLGTYLQVPHQQEITQLTKYKNANGVKVNSKFNSSTGEEHRAYMENQIEIIYPDAEMEDDDDFEDDYDLFRSVEGEELPNHSLFILNDDGDLGDISLHEKSTISMINMDFSKKLEEDKIKYKKHLDYYRKNYGDIKIDYGIVIYYN